MKETDLGVETEIQEHTRRTPGRGPSYMSMVWGLTMGVGGWLEGV